MRICLNYYLSLISNHIEEKNNDNLFLKDNMTTFYTTDILSKVAKIWTHDKIKIVLNLTTYLSGIDNAETDVKSLETIMSSIDGQVSHSLLF